MLSAQLIIVSMQQIITHTKQGGSKNPQDQHAYAICGMAT
jgi:hypothetical protein